MEIARPDIRVFHVDDMYVQRHALETYSPDYGMQIVLQAESVEDAMSLIPDGLIANQIQIALLDNDLRDPRGRKGDYIANAIRQSAREYPELKVGIISYSSDSGLEWGDENLGKVELDVLARAMLGLLERLRVDH